MKPKKLLKILVQGIVFFVGHNSKKKYISCAGEYYLIHNFDSSVVHRETEVDITT